VRQGGKEMDMSPTWKSVRSQRLTKVVYDNNPNGAPVFDFDEEIDLPPV